MTQYQIATSVLDAIVRGSLEGESRLRVHSSLPLVGSHPVDIKVDGEECHVTVHLDVRLGENLPDLAATVRQKIAGALGSMTGLTIKGVDVVVSGVFSPGV